MNKATGASNLSKLLTGVIAPLRQQGATIRLRLEFDVQNPGGIDPTLIELSVVETFKQLGIEVTLHREA
ncbi:hypothetical protein HC928_10805 [bacterium]|nr:hypothetical protein [bacterium]